MPWIVGKRGSFRVLWRTGGRDSQTKASQTFQSRVEAEDELRARKAEAAQDRASNRAPTSQTPIPVLLKRWKASRVSEGWATAVHCDNAIEILTGIAEEMDWGVALDVTRESIDRLRIKRKGVNVDRPIQLLKGFLRWCSRVADIRVNEKAITIPPKPRKKVIPPPRLTEAQVAAIFTKALEVGASISPQFKASAATMLEHMSLYGCRPVDLAKLTIKDATGTDGVVAYRGTKNGDDIAHAIHPGHAAKLAALAEGRAPDDPMFLDPFGRQWFINKRGAAGGITDWYRRHIGLPLVADGVLLPSQAGIYVLKDFACGRLLLAAGGNRRLAMTMSGHRTEDAFDRYVTTNEDGQRQLIAAIPEPGGQDA